MSLINCPECGKELSDTASKCPNCAYKLKKNRVGRRKIKLRKKYIIVFAILVLIFGASIIMYSYLNSPVKKAEKCLKEGDISQAQIVFDDTIKSDDKKIEKLKNRLNYIFEKAIESYAKDTNKYFVYSNLKKFVEKNYEDYDVTGIDKKMNQMRNSKEDYNEAKELQEEKKYKEAVESYEKVIESDSNYKNAQREMEQCKSAHKENILTEVNTQLSEEEPSYSDLEIVIRTTKYLKDDQEVDTKFAELKRKVRDCQVSKAQSLAEEEEYIKAMEAFDKIPEEFNNDENVVNAKGLITQSLINWVIKEAEKEARKKKYDSAVKLLNKYRIYDTGNIIAKKIYYYNGKIKKKVITEFKTLKKKVTLKYDSVDRIYQAVHKGYDPNYVNVSSTINMEARAVVDKRGKEVTFQLIAG